MKHIYRNILYLALIAPLALTFGMVKNDAHASNIPQSHIQKINYRPAKQIFTKTRRTSYRARNRQRIQKQTNNTEHQLAKRINRFAKYRKQYHYSNINWNARDLGGYRTFHGYYIKPNRIIRGGNLHYINRKGIRQFKQHHINKVIDIRSVNWHSGVRKLADPGEYYNNNKGIHPIYYVYPTNTDAQKYHDLKNVKKYGQIYNYNRPFVTYNTAKTSYRNIFRTMLNNKHGAIYFHCLEGHDRTGATSALILAALGVQKPTIYNDFLLTEEYQKKYSYTGQLADLNEFYHSINSRYGNIMKYLYKDVGITKKQMVTLRRMYLTKKMPKGYQTY